MRLTGWKLACFGALAIALSICGEAYGQRIIRVDSHAVGLADGTTWIDAFPDLQDALDDARLNGGCPCEIWVAGGTYKADRGTGDRYESFHLQKGVALYGGFAGSEPDRGQRDWKRNVTTLNGDLAGNDDTAVLPTSDCCSETGNAGCDDPACAQIVIAEDDFCARYWHERCQAAALKLCCDLCRPTRCDNSVHVLQALDSDETVVLDGFVVSGGEANGYDDAAGGGLYVPFAPLTLRNCTFSDNVAGVGSAIYGGEIDLIDLEFTRNGGYVYGIVADIHAFQQRTISVKRSNFRDNEAAGLRVVGSVAIQDCEFVNNLNPTASGAGATADYATVNRSRFIGNRGTALDINFSGVIVNTLFERNVAPYGRGALGTGTGATLVGCLFADNRALGTGAYGNSFGSPIIENCAFLNNQAEQGIGAIYSGGGLIARNTIFWGNRDPIFDSAEGTNFASEFDEDILIDSSIVENWTGAYGGLDNSGEDPLFVNPVGADNVAGTGDEDYRLSPDSPAINAGAITANTPDNDLDGHARVLCGAVDLGPYEFGIADFNCDREITLADAAGWPSCMDGPADPLSLAKGEGGVRVVPDPDLPLTPSLARRGEGCESLDFNGDNGIDLADFAEWQRLFGNDAP